MNGERKCARNKNSMKRESVLEGEREIVRVRGGSNGRMGLWEGERIKGKCGERECVERGNVRRK